MSESESTNSRLIALRAERLRWSVVGVVVIKGCGGVSFCFVSETAEIKTKNQPKQLFAIK